jgi:hypothetical protein
MGLLSLSGKSTASKKRRSKLRVPKKTANIQTLKNYVEKQSKRLSTAIERVELLEQVSFLSKAKPQDYAKKMKLNIK